LKPVNLKKALRTLEFTNGVVIKVSDNEIMDAMAMVSKNGFGCEPASAATVAGTKKLVESGEILPDDMVVGILTGHILKDISALVNYHYNPRNQFSNNPMTIKANVEEVLKLVKV
jgi:threonine synthase